MFVIVLTPQLSLLSTLLFQKAIMLHTHTHTHTHTQMGSEDKKSSKNGKKRIVGMNSK